MPGEHELFILMGKALAYLSLGVYRAALAIFWWPLLVLRNMARSFREFGVDKLAAGQRIDYEPKGERHTWLDRGSRSRAVGVQHAGCTANIIPAP